MVSKRALSGERAWQELQESSAKELFLANGRGSASLMMIASWPASPSSAPSYRRPCSCAKSTSVCQEVIRKAGEGYHGEWAGEH
eukprot:COSAG02_NODE_2725_length_8156_cov_3.067271_3_plen_84_part_00